MMLFSGFMGLGLPFTTEWLYLIFAFIIAVVFWQVRRRVGGTPEIMRLIEVDEDTIRIRLPPKNEEIRKEFLDESLQRNPVYEDVSLRYKDPEETRMHIRGSARGMGYAVLHNEIDHWDVQFGEGPMFRQVVPKTFILTFKGRKFHKAPRIVGYIVMVMGGVLILVSLLEGLGLYLGAFNLFLYGPLLQGPIPIILLTMLGFPGLVAIVVGNWIAKPLMLWIKGTGVAYGVEGKRFFSDQYFQFSAESGFQGMGKAEILREDFDRILEETIRFLGEGEEPRALLV